MDHDDPADFTEDAPSVIEGKDSQPKTLKSHHAARSLAKAVMDDLIAVRDIARDWLRVNYSKLSRLSQKPSMSAGFKHVLSWFAAMSGRLQATMLNIRNRHREAPNSNSGRAIMTSWKGVLTAGFLMGLLFIAGIMTWALADVRWEEISRGAARQGVVLEMSDGTPLVRHGPYQAAYAGYDDFPPQLIDAVISIEDRRFMDHHGIDLKGIARAFFRNLRAGAVVQGGSTITQQLIKVQYLDSDRTLKRKIQEVVLAFWLEWKLGKQEILTRYLNTVYLGAGATGMPAAARVYFNKDIKELDLPEAALLAGLMKAPSQYNPISSPENARQRTDIVLDAMVDNGKIDAQEAETAKSQLAGLGSHSAIPRMGSWFADWLSDQVSDIGGSSKGVTTIRTTLVPRYQQIAEEAVAKVLEEDGKAMGASQAALVAMKPDGAVVAMVGGNDYRKSQFNRAVTAMRQPGSTFKLFVYYAALKQGMTLRDRILDAPVQIDGWTPQNSGEGYQGWVTPGEAFARSLNAAAAGLAQQVGIDNVISAARELGLQAPLKASPSLALGTSEVSLVDLTGAYASVRLGRAPVRPWGVIDYKAAAQADAFRVGPTVKPTLDISPYQHDLTTLLELVVERGTGRAAALDGFAAGKTGTSQDNRDAWFVGFTEPLVVGVWVGNDDDTPMKGVTGGAMPAKMWKEFMQAAMKEPAANPGAAMETPTDVESTAPACNIAVCSRNYRSFRSSDCSYQPYGGERRLCEK